MKSDLANFTDTVVITIDHSDTTGKTDTLKFTRNVNKVRTAVYHFRNVTYRPLDPTFSSDTLPPLIQLVISEPLQVLTRKVMLIQNYYFSAYGNTLQRQSGNFKRIKAGTDSYQIIFETDPSHKHLSLVTIKNNLTGNSISFDRRFGRIFRRWW